MKCVILANGDYGNTDSYKWLLNEADIILCADGGANYAYARCYPSIGRIPDPSAEQIMSRSKISKISSARLTDTQYTCSAEELNADETVFSIGKRLTIPFHIYCELNSSKQESMDYTTTSAYLVTRRLSLVEKWKYRSVLVLTDQIKYMRNFGISRKCYSKMNPGHIKMCWHMHKVSEDYYGNPLSWKLIRNSVKVGGTM